MIRTLAAQAAGLLLLRARWQFVLRGWLAVGGRAGAQWVLQVQSPEPLAAHCPPCRWWCLLIVAGYVLAFAFLSVVFLKYVSFLKR